MLWLAIHLLFLISLSSGQQQSAGQQNVTTQVSQVLNPPSFNLAEGRKISASSTCGEGEGVVEPEIYCKLVGANWVDSPTKNIFQGQACDYCDPNTPSLSHKAEYAIDGTERWWQSPPLSRGVRFNEVNVTIDLGQEFHVAYVFIKMANSPRPGVWILERSKDHGKTYTPWQFFADNHDDCSSIFGISTRTITRDDSVICETKYSKVLPLENGEIAVSLLNGRPSAENFGLSQGLQEFTKATNIRLRLLRPKTTLGHLISIAKQDPTVTRRYFYSIKDINIGGRCVCNGHANSCDITDASQPQILHCKCQHNTCGTQCGECCDGFVQKKWKPATIENPNICKPCNCFNHSKTCYYNETIDNLKLSLDAELNLDGGGVCTECEDNTEGINCNKCKDTFYRPANRPLEAKNVCEPCKCDDRYYNGSCAEGSGNCFCKENFQEPDCKECSYGFTGFPDCKPCDCHLDGTIGSVCQLRTGQCPCKPEYMGQFCKNCSRGHFGPKCSPCDCTGAGVVENSNATNVCDLESGQCGCRAEFSGRQCDKCAIGFYGYPDCQSCQCDVAGTTSEVCDPESGTCLCKPGFGGPRCDECQLGFFSFPNCTACNCDLTGSTSPVCSPSGKCRCSPSFGGLKCADCSVGHYKYPECLACNCDQSGSHGSSCDTEGRCICKSNFDGNKCEACREGFYNYPACEECNCDPAGVAVAFKGCASVAAGELCKCKERVTGRICNQCKDLYWNLKEYYKDGCEECRCNRPGTINSVGNCNGKSGQCMCRDNVESLACDTCKAGTFALQEGNLFGCTECRCDIGGSSSAICDKFDGRCTCKPKITGRRCDQPLTKHYFPTLYQHQYEIEDGRTIADSPARFGYNETLFPDYSWRGYAAFSSIMREVIFPIQVSKPAFYRSIFRYVNLGDDAAAAVLTLTPDGRDPNEDIQTAHIFLEPSKEPKTQFGTTKLGQLTPVLLSPEKWTASLRVDRDVLIDFMVLIPEAYYEARLLREMDPPPCQDEQDPLSLCRHFSYPGYPEETTVFPAVPDGIQDERSKKDANKKVDDLELVKRLKSVPESRAAIDSMNARLEIPIPMPDRDPRLAPNRQVIVINYHTPSDSSLPINEPSKLAVEVSDGVKATPTEISFADCPYSFVCRQAVTGPDGDVWTFDLGSKATISFQKNDISVNKTTLIESVNLIPYKNWTLDYVKSKYVCVVKNKDCIESRYSPTSERKVEFERDQNPERTVIVRHSATPLVYVNDSDSGVEIKDKVQSPGRYNFVLHYKQPDHPSFDADVRIQGDQIFNAMTQLEYCPSLTGCRAVILQRESNSSTFYIPDGFKLSVKSPAGKSVLLDYVLIIPVDAVDDNTMSLEPQVKSFDFVQECGLNAFDMDNSTSAYCKKSVFSLTADYNGYALPCKCNIQGSRGSECNKFGGQCNCKPNVIGRQCSRCKTGFFGFPDCKACNCPSTAYCDERTGKCLCPPKVTGDQCDQCMIHTYGFDKYLGCEECNCQSKGVLKLPNGKADLQCNTTSGQCPCRQTIVGRTCDQCLSGYAYYPYCQFCNCDQRGVTDKICDQMTSKCFCKEHVRGDSCDICSPDSFNIEESNPDGCTKCFCFGTSDRCRSSQLFRIQVSDMSSGYDVLSIATTGSGLDIVKLEDGKDFRIEYLGDKISVNLLQETSSLEGNRNYYVSLPAVFLGKKITSYGGNFSYSIENLLTSPERVGAPLTFDFILVGSKLSIGYMQDDQPEDPNAAFGYNVSLNERNFRHPSRNDVTREQMMMVLVHLEQVYIRLSYFKQSTGFNVYHLLMDVATNQTVGDAAVAQRVEQCFCPRGYKGSSCEECNDGYYRLQTGPYLGYCVPCQCNGHADACDVATGKCGPPEYVSPDVTPPVDSTPTPETRVTPPEPITVGYCKHNTHGEYCQYCNPGYYGNATKGGPHDCLICPCPRPDVSNNFAISCVVPEDGLTPVSCTCKPGYEEPRCDTCSPGFYGKPFELGDYCKPCQCNENIIPSEPGSCDSVNGTCLKCLNNTAGPACEICAPGYFGDAIERKDCKRCLCDACGTDRCDDKTGQCLCKPNVVGDLCDQCARDHYGLERQMTCDGCVPCQCANASLTTSCDPLSGQCQCQPGVGGRICDTCEPGFWRYSPDGCTSCNCGARFSQGAVCDQSSGQCQCLPGVIGKNCDSCPWRWVFTEKIGCKECKECQHFLLDDTDGMRNVTAEVRKELQEASLSVFARRKANYVSQQVDDYQVAINDFVLRPKVDLSSVDLSVKEAEANISLYAQNSTRMLQSAAKVAEDANTIRLLGLNETDAFKKTINESIDLLNELTSLEESFGSPVVFQNLEHKIISAEQVLDELKGKDFSNETAVNKNELDAAENLSEECRSKSTPAQSASKLINDTLSTLSRLNSSVNALFNQSAQANLLVVASEQSNMIASNTQVEINQAKSDALRAVNASNGTNADIKIRLDECKPNLIQFQSLSTEMAYATTQLKDKKETLREHLKDRILNPDELRPFARQATDHSFNMYSNARDLVKLFKSTKMGAIDAISASEAYQSIANNITEAIISISKAAIFTTALEEQKNATRENVDTSKKISDQLKQEAADLSLNFASRFEQPVETAVSKVNGIAGSLVELKDAYASIANALSALPNKELEALSRTAATSAVSVLNDVKGVEEKIASIDTQISEGAKEAEKIPVAYREINNDIKNGNSYTSRVTEAVPGTNKLLTKAEARIPNIANQQKVLNAKIEEIRKAIKSARGLANRIETGVQFNENTTLQLRNPENLLTSGTYTKFALSFKTKEYNALLAYIGNPLAVMQSKRKKRAAVNESSPHWLSETELNDQTTPTDFLALEIRNSRVVFTIDLGSGPERTENGMFVSNDIWHDVVVERIGKQVTLLVSANDSKQERSDSMLVGTHNVFNVDPVRSRILIGGIPASITIQKDVINKDLKSGSIASIAFGDTPLGLWNFVEGVENKNGSEQRQVMTDVTSNGMRFDADSYVILPKGKFDFALETYVQLAFKTFARDGLLFLIGDDHIDFLAIYMSEGRVQVSFDLGSGFVMLSTKEGKNLNDGQWHNIDLARREKDAILKVDGVESEVKEAIGRQSDLRTNDQIFIGGFPGSHSYPIPKVNFEGCIRDLQIGNLKLDLNKNNESSPNVIKGCPAAISREASFGEAYGFVEMPLTTDITDFAILTMKYRTLEKPGLLFFVSNPDFTSFIALYISERGHVVLRTDPGNEMVMTKKPFIGDSWHYITVTKDQSKLQIEIDDEFGEDAKISTSTPLSIPSNNTLMYFGGVPKDQVYLLVGKSIPSRFVGCFGDVTLNSQFQNFATSSNRPAASLASCPLHKTAASSSTGETKLNETIATVTPVPEITETTTSITIDGCSIPLNPQVETNISPENGLRFGNAHDSRLEFQMSTSLQSSFLDSSRFEIQLKTTATEGVIVYVGSKQVDFAGLFLFEGRLYFSWNLGGKVASIRKEETINDGKWHKVSFSREKREGRLKVDDDTELTNVSIGEESSLNVKAPVFVGGLSDEAAKQAKNNLRGVSNSFPGCLRALKIQDELQDFAKNSISYSAQGCSDNVEPGVFFHSSGGRVILKEKFRVGEKIKIDMKIRPRSKSGTLLSVSGKSDFMILQMVNGNLKFSVDNGGGVMTVVHTPSTPLCDGGWHTVQAVKVQNIITLKSDNNNMGIQVGTGGISSTDTNDPLYVGGVPSSDSTPGLETREQFVGCISDLKISDRLMPFTSAIVVGDVTLSACPTT